MGGSIECARHEQREKKQDERLTAKTLHRFLVSSYNAKSTNPTHRDREGCKAGSSVRVHFN